MSSVFVAAVFGFGVEFVFLVVGLNIFFVAALVFYPRN